MKVTINDIEYNIPTTLSAVTLQQRIEFEKQVTKVLQPQLKSVLAEKDELLKGLLISDYQVELAKHSLAHFAGIPLETMDNVYVDDVLNYWNACMWSYAQEVDFSNPDAELVLEFGWNDELWVIAPPVLSPNSRMTFNEFITGKQITANMIKLGQGNWESLLPLCCIYFRKKDEDFQESFVDKEGERYKLMQTLPMDFAMHVGFFLSVSQRSWVNTFLYSIHPGESLPEGS